ncbi:MAG: helix-turn-helix transcriptional regulator [Planctomycetes bacterium]|nr:helix-turn-helix transcriptional regulator [Planctomycetota bacterium]
MITSRTLLLSAGSGPIALPRVERVAWEHQDGDYRRDSAARTYAQAAVQITLRGQGALLSPGGAVIAPLPRGTALCFVAQRQPVLYGVAPGSAEPWEFVYANLDGEAALATVDQLVAGHGHVLPISADHAVVQALLGLLPAAALSHRRISAAVSARLACDLLAALVEGIEGGDDPDRALVEDAMAFLSARIEAPVGIAQAAQRCGVSREHLTRVFTRSCGEAPATWLRRQRLRHAEILLRTSALPIAEIGRRCGFAGASHFVQAFRRHAGVTPARWRG